MISNAAVFLVVLPILIVVFTLMDPIGTLRASRSSQPEVLPVLPVSQALPTPVLLPQPADANRFVPQSVASVQEAVQVQQAVAQDAVVVHLDDPFFDEEEDAPLVEPPEGWEHMAEHLGRMPTFDCSESDRYNIAEGGKNVDEQVEEFVDEDRGVYQTPRFEFEPQAA
jgi:hypothetical protein